MAMTKGLWRASRAINNSYQQRYRKKASKGMGFYAFGLPGTPNGLHVQVRDPKSEPCRCGGCSTKGKA